MVNGNALALSVSMAGCGSSAVVTMTGTLQGEGGTTIKTEGVIQFDGEDNWNSRVQTSDVYTWMNSPMSSHVQ